MGTIVSEFNPVPGQLYDLFCAVSGHYKTGNFHIYRELLNIRTDKTTEAALRPISGLLENRPRGLELFFGYFRGRSPCITTIYLPELSRYKDPAAFISGFAACDAKDLCARVLSYYDSGRQGMNFYAKLVEEPCRCKKYVEEIRDIHLLRVELLSFLYDPQPAIHDTAELLRKALPFVQQLHRKRRLALEEFCRRKIAEFEETGLRFSEGPGHVLMDTAKIGKLTLSVTIVNPYTCYVAVRGGEAFIYLGRDYERALGRDRCENDDIDVYRVSRAMSDELRFCILEQLDRGEMYLSELAGVFSLPPPAVSYHLNLLLSANLITMRTEGRRVYYSVNRPYIRSLSRFFFATFGGG